MTTDEIKAKISEAEKLVDKTAAAIRADNLAFMQAVVDGAAENQKRNLESGALLSKLKSVKGEWEKMLAEVEPCKSK